ncbi:MAG: DUF1579 domain-containing protein [Planctomycetia bacterium]|nr:DUF1579 domain-containing protein [Planctomycetia bacterium]
MKTKFAAVLAATAVACVFFARPLWSDENGAGGDDREKPGPEHRRLAKLEGKWDVSCKFWMGDPKTDGQPSQATSEFKVILDGRYVQQDFNGTFMGAPYHGMGTMGYDRVSKKYTNYWMDNVSTTPMYLLGTTGDDGKTVEYPGEMANPMGEGTVKYRTVMTHKSDDEFTYEMYATFDGKESKGMELTYTRKK